MSETRIKFIVETPVDLESLPVHAWGRCLRRHEVSDPVIEDGVFIMRQVSVDHWVLPVGAIVQLPTDRAAAYIADGKAEDVTDSLTGLGKFHLVEPADRERTAG